jgi:hypothetical protein
MRCLCNDYRGPTWPSRPWNTLAGALVHPARCAVGARCAAGPAVLRCPRVACGGRGRVCTVRSRSCPDQCVELPHVIQPGWYTALPVFRHIHLLVSQAGPTKAPAEGRNKHTRGHTRVFHGGDDTRAIRQWGYRQNWLVLCVKEGLMSKPSISAPPGERHILTDHQQAGTSQETDWRGRARVPVRRPRAVLPRVQLGSGDRPGQADLRQLSGAGSVPGLGAEPRCRQRHLGRPDRSGAACDDNWRRTTCLRP